MTEEYVYRNALSDINISGLFLWRSFLFKHRKTRIVLAGAMAFWTVANLYITIFGTMGALLGFFVVVGGGFLTLSILFYESDRSFIFFLAGFTLTGIASTILGIAVVVLYSYFTYILLRVRQNRKAEKYAKMTPREIAKIGSGKKPRMEITFRGGES